MSRLPFNLAIANPCQQPWHEMHGTGTQRHCDSCNKIVHNLASLTPRQIERLIHDSDGNVRARITRRQDGTIAIAPLEPSLYAASAILAASLLSPTMSAQESKTPAVTTITGFVQDQAGAMIPHATVKLVRPDLTEITAQTDDQGSYAIVCPMGTYTFRVEMPGFSSSVQPIAVDGRHESLPPIILQFVGIEMGDIVVIDRRPWYKKAASRTVRVLHL